MVTPSPKKAAPSSASFTVRRGGVRKTLSYHHLFTMGHKLWVARKYTQAKPMFELLATVTDRGPRAHIFLAHCHVMHGDFGQCSATLNEAFDNRDSEDAGADLHAAFVFWRVGLWNDVSRIFQSIVEEHPRLPTPYLFFADVLSRLGLRDRSIRCLQKAIRTDRQNGVIGQIARRELVTKFATQSSRQSVRVQRKED